MSATLPEASIERRFVVFHEANPHIYDSLVALAREAKARGAMKLGIEQLWAVMRWQRHDYRVSDESSTYRLNDHYTSRYARLIMRREADLDGIFDTRSLRTPSVLFPVADEAQIALFEEGLA
jgi:hypothetical protein